MQERQPTCLRAWPPPARSMAGLIFPHHTSKRSAAPPAVPVQQPHCRTAGAAAAGGPPPRHAQRQGPLQRRRRAQPWHSGAVGGVDVETERQGTDAEDDAATPEALVGPAHAATNHAHSQPPCSWASAGKKGQGGRATCSCARFGRSSQRKHTSAHTMRSRARAGSSSDGIGQTSSAALRTQRQPPGRVHRGGQRARALRCHGCGPRAQRAGRGCTDMRPNRGECPVVAKGARRAKRQALPLVRNKALSADPLDETRCTLCFSFASFSKEKHRKKQHACRGSGSR